MIEWGHPAWSCQAKCCGTSPAFYFPVKGVGRDTTAEVQAAKAVCNGRDGKPPCVVKQECLEYALDHHEKFGVWGGRSERERSRLKRIRKRVNGVPKVIRTVKKSSLARVLATTKSTSRILGAVQRHLLVRPPEDRAQDVIHPSEMCKSDWCSRKVFFRLAGAPASEAGDAPSFTLENVFQEGHDIHGKWQNWLWEMGVLRGQFRCHACQTSFAATSPKGCPLCQAARGCLTYEEVALRSDTHLIAGHADGDIADDEAEELCALLEVKSIGIGTIRFEAPKLLAKHTFKVQDDGGAEHGVVDYEGVWRDIRRPFPTHLKQGNLYLAISGRKTMVFIYESKWNQQVKEFRVKYQPELVADLLDDCLDIKYALTTGRPPHRPAWAVASDGPSCKSCIYSAHCWDSYLNEAAHAGENQPGARNGREGGESQGSHRVRRVQVAGSSGLRNTPAPA